uniref:(S)-2-hydroxy-acid oxidase n=1 Tax=Lutzomyia longipalpis TaxID=7200 RepID=A0A7G3AIW4_LUTLO
MELTSVDDFRERAWSLLPKGPLDYYRSGAGDEYSLRLNQSAFDRPTYLKDVSERTTKTNVLGINMDMPVGIAPTAMQRMAHPEGEVANAKAAAASGVLFTLSTIATSSIEEVAEATPESNKWFQLYIYRDRELTKNLVRRAEKNGYKAIVLTVDAPLFGLRRRDVKNKFTLAPHLQLANFVGEKATGVHNSEGGSGLLEYRCSYRGLSVEAMELTSVDDFRERAWSLLPKGPLDYYRSGAGDEYSLRLNQSAFDRPTYLKDVSERTTKTNVLGINMDMPVGIAPTAMQRMAHPEGEVANAKAAAASGVLFTLSTIATSSIEEVAEATPESNKWFQLYIYRDRELTKNLVRRAEKNGYKAIVLTVDAPLFGLRRRDVKNKFTLAPHLQLANFVGEKATGVHNSEGGSGLLEYVNKQFDDSITWEDVKWLVEFTKLPVIAKGILTAEDATTAVQCGCRGIIVSNHGARQIDGVPASIEALPEVVAAVGERVTVMMDGGIRQGTDVFKALALGAKLVFIGRPAIWGLTADGQRGVETILKIIKNELNICMAIAGCPTVSDISRKYVVHESYYSKL